MKFRLTITILALYAVLLAGCSGLAGEPRIVATMPPATALPTAAPFPAEHPDVALGAEIFAANCTRCHGIDGKGNGELVQSGQVAKAADFTDATTTVERSPSDFYATITDGKLASLMPPWRDSLTDTERWAVAMYTYTLPFSQEQIVRGGELFAANCTNCDLSDTADLGGAELNTKIAEMPEFAALDDTDRTAIAAYARAQTVSNASAIGTILQAEAPAETAEPNAPGTEEATEIADLPDTVTVSGTITNGTAGGSVPADLTVALYVFDADFNRDQIGGSADAEGNFSFADVPFNADGTYAVTVVYRDTVFASDLLAGDALISEAADGTLNLPIPIYELTEDPSVIKIVGMVTQVSMEPDALQVAQVFQVTNTGDRAFTSTQTASNGAPISLVMSLPPGAVVVGFPNNQDRFIFDQNTFTVLDTLPVLPGVEQFVQVVYIIPYSSNGAIIEQQINYALEGPVRLLVSPPSATVTSEQLAPRGTENIGTTQMQSYGGDLTLAAGDVLRFELSGAGTPSSGTQATTTNIVPIVIAALLVAALIGGGFLVLGTRSHSGDQQVIDILVRQIAELDAEHEAGRIDDEAYERQRSALKGRLATLMERKK